MRLGSHERIRWSARRVDIPHAAQSERFPSGAASAP